MKEPMTIDDAICIATNWISESDLPFSSAFISGSVASAPRDAVYESTSDIDCYLVTDGDPPDGKIGKITVNGALLDVSWIPWSALENAETDAVLASLLYFGLVVQDDGKLGKLQNKIKTDFITPETLTERVESIRDKIRNGLAVDSSHLSLPEQVMNWLFPATLVTHISLVVSCSPLTVRKRFLAAKAVMQPDHYERLLILYGFDTVTKEQAQDWLDATARLFDATTDVAEKSNRFWATDIQADARHIAIGGSQQLIDDGNHREALFWIVATSSRCLTVRNDANMDSVQFLREYWHMLRALMLETAELRQMRTDAILGWV